MPIGLVGTPHFRMPHLTLRTRILLVNATVVGLAALATAQMVCGGLGSDALVVAAGAVMVGAVLNSVLLARFLVPVEELVDTMDHVDLTESGLRAPGGPAGSPEVERLRGAFDHMIGRLEAERRAAGRAVLRAQEEERAAIAQDLHDEVNQSLTGVLLHLEILRGDAEERGEAALARGMHEVKGLTNGAIEELLTLARRLRPTVLGDHGLIPALQSQVQDFGRRTGIDARFLRHGAIPPLDDEQQLVLYRVCQESLSNIAKHAGARTVCVELSFTGRPMLRVADDGAGFDQLAAAARRNGARGLGLSGMKERALLVGGRLQIFSRAGQGTTVELTLNGGEPAR